MPKKRNRTKPSTPKQQFHRLLTTFEECVCDAITLKAALMIMINNERFSEHNFDIAVARLHSPAASA